MNWPFHFLWSSLSIIQLGIRAPLIVPVRLLVLVMIPPLRTLILGYLDPEDESAASHDYACLVAFDSTRDQILVDAWKYLDEDVKRAFWRELRVYAMILLEGASMAQLLNE